MTGRLQVCRRRQGRPSSLASVALVLMCGCAAPQAPSPVPPDAATQSGWGRIDLPVDSTAAGWRMRPYRDHVYAHVKAESGGAILLYACRPADYAVVLSLILADSSDLSETQHATMAFDGGAPIDSILQATEHEGAVAYHLVDLDPQFQPAIDKLMAYRTVDVTIMESSTVVRRERFTLNEAARTIAKVARLCGH